MADNTEETLISGMSEETKRSVMDAVKKEKKSKVGNGSPWRKTAIGGITGMMLGSAGTVAAHEVINHHDSHWGDLKMATKVDDSQSFKEAFDAAHDEVGAGGVFTWHGNVYSTYSEKEWNALTEEQRDSFNEHVMAIAKAEGTSADKHADVQADAATNHVAQAHADESDDVQIIGSDDTPDVSYAIDDVYIVNVDETPVVEVAELGDDADSLTADALQADAGTNYLADEGEVSSPDEVFMA